MNSNDIFKLLDCVIFQCKPRCTLTDAQQGMLADVLEGEAEEENDIISDFISRYTGNYFRGGSKTKEAIKMGKMEMTICTLP